MATISYDHDRLRRAVVLLLSQRFGEGRAAFLQQKIESMPEKRPHRYQKPLEDLNEFLLVAYQSRSKALELLDLVNSRRSMIIAEAEAKMDPKLIERRMKGARAMREHRERLDLAVKTEEVRRGHKLSPQEKKEYQKELVADWTKRRAAFRSTCGLPSGEANSAFSYRLSAELNDEYQEAKRAEERRRLSDPSLRRLEAKQSRAGASPEALAKLVNKWKGA